MTQLKDRSEKEISEIYNMVENEVQKMLATIDKKTGYYSTGTFLLYNDEPKKCINVEMNICLLEAPHAENEYKVEYYKKHNPDNVLEKPIYAHAHNSWYKIYDGVHRKIANEELGKKTIKVNIIIPDPKAE